MALGHLHDSIILILRLESFRVLLSRAKKGLRNLTEITKFKYEKKSEKDSGRSNTMYNEDIAQMAIILLIYC